MTQTQWTTNKKTPRTSLIQKLASKYSVDPEKMLATLKATAFKQPKDKRQPTDEEMMALLVVADQYNLNPWLREIYAFPAKNGGIQAIVPIDGWLKIINNHPQMDGLVTEDQLDQAGNLVAVTCKIYRKDRKYPIVVTEYLSECYRDTGPWKWKARMLRHKAVIQGGRYAFGFSGIVDPDEGERIIESEAVLDERPTVNMPTAIVEPDHFIGNDFNLGRPVDRPAPTEPDHGVLTVDLPRMLDASTQPLTGGQVKVITAKLLTAGITESEMFTHFNVQSFDQLGGGAVNEILSWIGNPTG